MSKESVVGKIIYQKRPYLFFFESPSMTKSTRSVQLLRQMTHHLRLYVHGISLSLSTLYRYESRPNTFECKISIKSGKNRKLLFFAM